MVLNGLVVVPLFFLVLVAFVVGMIAYRTRGSKTPAVDASPQAETAVETPGAGAAIPLPAPAPDGSFLDFDRHVAEAIAISNGQPFRIRAFCYACGTGMHFRDASEVITHIRGHQEPPEWTPSSAADFQEWEAEVNAK